jgi:hypothetical protein
MRMIGESVLMNEGEEGVLTTIFWKFEESYDSGDVCTARNPFLFLRASAGASGHKDKRIS